MKWERAAVFISSTFNDMHAERDYLVKNVFPRLREWCEEHRIHLVDIDLRWGIRSEDSQSNNTVRACLQNIDDSRPFFLNFLGQRRGWLPSVRDLSDNTTLEYPDVLKRVEAGKSITELEIEHALLSPLMHLVKGSPQIPHPARRAFFFFRNDPFGGELLPPQREVYTNASAIDPAHEDRELETLKAEIDQKWDGVYRYDCRWNSEMASPELIGIGNEDASRGRLQDFRIGDKEMGAVIIRELKDAILEEFPDHKQLPAETPLERGLSQQHLFITNNSEGYIPGKDSFDALDAYLADACTAPLVITAAAGLGKTMFLANWTKRLDERDDLRIFPRFCGAADMNAEVYSLWSSIFAEAGIEAPPNMETLERELDEKLAELAAQSDPRTCTLIIIDAIDQLPRGIEMCDWLPRHLPPKLKLVVSLRRDETSEPTLDRLSRAGLSLFEISPLTTDAAKQAIIEEYLKSYLKALDTEQIAAICGIKSSQNPLFLKILLFEIRVFGSFVTLTDELTNYGDTPASAFDAMLTRLENDTASFDLAANRFVPILFSALAAARKGLSEDELVFVIRPYFPLDNEQLLRNSLRYFIRQVRPFMARRDGRTDFFYESLRIATERRYEDRLPQMHGHLAKCFARQADPNNSGCFTAEKPRPFEELPYHLNRAGLSHDLCELLLNYAWVFRKSELCGIDSVVADYDAYGMVAEEDAVPLVGEALTLSAHIVRQDIRQLPSQLWGRLADFEDERIKTLLADAAAQSDYPWLQPLKSCMVRPGTPLLKTWKRQPAKLTQLAMMPDGERLLGASDENCVKIWNLKNGKILLSLEHGAPVKTVTASRDGTMIASGTSTGKIHVWDAVSGDLITDFQAERDTPGALLFSYASNYLLAGCGSIVKVWETENWNLVRKLCGHAMDITALAPGARPNTIVSASADNSAILWDCETGAILKSYIVRYDPFDLMQVGSDFTQSIASIVMTPDGTKLFSGASNRFVKTIDVWDAESEERVQRLPSHEFGIIHLALSPDGKTLASGAYDNFIHIRDLETGTSINHFEGGANGIVDLVFSPDGKRLISLDGENQIRIWDPFRCETGADKRHKGPAEDVFYAEHRGRGFIISAGGVMDKTIQMRDADDFRLLHTLRGHQFGINALAAAAGPLFFSVSSDMTLCGWSYDRSEDLEAIQVHDGPVLTLATMKQKGSECLITGSTDTLVKAANAAKGSVCVHTGPKDAVESVAVCESKGIIAAGSFDGNIYFWRSGKERPYKILTGHTHKVWKVLFSHDGKKLYSASIDKSIRIWDVKSGEVLQTLKGHTDGIMSLALSPDNRLLYSGSYDHTVKVWDLATARVVYEFMTDNGVTAIVARDKDPYVLYATDFSGEIYALLPRNFDRLEADGSSNDSSGGSAGGSANDSDAGSDGGSGDKKPAGTSLADASPASEHKPKTGLLGRLFGR
jgi:WD40 repeat protein